MLDVGGANNTGGGGDGKEGSYVEQYLMGDKKCEGARVRDELKERIARVGMKSGDESMNESGS